MALASGIEASSPTSSSLNSIEVACRLHQSQARRVHLGEHLVERPDAGSSCRWRARPRRTPRAAPSRPGRGPAATTSRSRTPRAARSTRPRRCPSSLSSSPRLEHPVGEVEDVGVPGQLAQVVDDVVVDQPVAVVGREQAGAARRLARRVLRGGPDRRAARAPASRPSWPPDEQVVQQRVRRPRPWGRGSCTSTTRGRSRRLGARRSRQPSSTKWRSGSMRRVASRLASAYPSSSKAAARRAPPPSAQRGLRLRSGRLRLAVGRRAAARRPARPRRGAGAGRVRRGRRARQRRTKRAPALAGSRRTRRRPRLEVRHRSRLGRVAVRAPPSSDSRKWTSGLTPSSSTSGWSSTYRRGVEVGPWRADRAGRVAQEVQPRLLAGADDVVVVAQVPARRRTAGTSGSAPARAAPRRWVRPADGRAGCACGRVRNRRCATVRPVPPTARPRTSGPRCAPRASWPAASRTAPARCGPWSARRGEVPPRPAVGAARCRRRARARPYRRATMTGRRATARR